MLAEQRKDLKVSTGKLKGILALINKLAFNIKHVAFTHNAHIDGGCNESLDSWQLPRTLFSFLQAGLPQACDRYRLYNVAV